MTKLDLLVDSGADEAWLFADLFASLLMTIVLLVTSHTTTKPKNIDDNGKPPLNTRIVFLHEKQQVSLDSFSSKKLFIDDVVIVLNKERVRVEVVGGVKNNGVELFEVFNKLQANEIEYSYAISQ